MRLFVAVFPPSATQQAAARTIDRLRRPDDRVSWVKTENLHYTLRFLGEVGEDGARRVADAARKAASGVAPFEAALGSLGAFPDPRRARVLWAGLERGGPELEALSRALDQGLASFGRPDRQFSAHLTIGRIREPGPDWTGRLQDARIEGEARRFRVETLSVVQSQLNPKGSIYTILEAAPLGG